MLVSLLFLIILSLILPQSTARDHHIHLSPPPSSAVSLPPQSPPTQPPCPSMSNPPTVSSPKPHPMPPSLSSPMPPYPTYNSSTPPPPPPPPPPPSSTDSYSPQLPKPIGSLTTPVALPYSTGQQPESTSSPMANSLLVKIAGAIISSLVVFLLVRFGACKKVEVEALVAPVGDNAQAINI